MTNQNGLKVERGGFQTSCSQRDGSSKSTTRKVNSNFFSLFQNISFSLLQHICFVSTVTSAQYLYWYHFRQVQLLPALEGGAHVQVRQARHRLHDGQQPVHAGGYWEHPQDLPAGHIYSIKYAGTKFLICCSGVEREEERGGGVVGFKLAS